MARFTDGELAAMAEELRGALLYCNAMNFSEPRFLFAGLCWLGMAAIAFGAIVEIRGRFSAELLGERHFAIRLFSALCWLVALGLLSYAVTVQWPVPGDENSKRVFARYLLSGSVALLGALLLSLLDFFLFWRARIAYQHYFTERMAKMVRDKYENEAPPDTTDEGE